MTTIAFDDYLAEQLKDEEFKTEFIQARAQTEQAVQLLLTREAAGYSQRELAELAHVPQSTIARIEKGANTSIDTLSKIAKALGKELKVSFV
ncbi:TPA: helix-turn-helix transcriptional regulator [Streptococcus suis]|uniref:helix-turn-helix domain-containing protein n=1 Tax=Streptococcus sp. ZY1909104 TaxID=3233335 RepID=UPI0015558D11|nr:helix-turn-helix transcriptional regulator [Streptococcus suis]MDW8759464.1 helix-turn-helix transcriptional regulator [Streptococcus suis]NQG96769.1 helix-turn-helix transcriptional regulator [Streptococcus suis]HEM5082107.1 helix-turn-helix transcriptional regulator [Streptococcus suis]HEM5208029.1 helix-turn-helix transcriptional regulator [Streptococcus suis]